MCVRPAALVQGEADEQPDPEFLVPALLEAAQQQQVMAALNDLYDGTGACKPLFSQQLLTGYLQSHVTLVYCCWSPVIHTLSLTSCLGNWHWGFLEQRHVNPIEHHSPKTTEPESDHHSL
jgi:hypothetical protein